MALFDLLGRAWAMGIIWQLDDGPFTFRQLRAACEDVSPTLLSRRLHELRTTGIVELGTAGYQLSELGRQLMVMLEPIGQWSKIWAAEITGWSDD